MATYRIIISGFGGQGIVAAGKLLAYAGLLEGKQVSMLPSYGPEMRGGFANCQVILSDEPIPSPIIASPDVLVAMSLPALKKFEPAIQPGATVVVDSTQIQKIPHREGVVFLPVPATGMAMDLGLTQLANVVMMGAVMAAMGSPDRDSMVQAIQALLPESKAHLIPLEIKALQAGMELGQPALGRQAARVCS